MHSETFSQTTECTRWLRARIIATLTPIRTDPYLHVVGSWDVGCSFEGVRHISQDLRGKEKVATVVAPPLQKLQETPYDLRHALPGQGPLTLRKMLS